MHGLDLRKLAMKAAMVYMCLVGKFSMDGWIRIGWEPGSDFGHLSGSGGDRGGAGVEQDVSVDFAQ